ncbi:MAG: hypothetical protein L0154_15590 [Chloroflexi bacterium]|nr:hypothetical protein [Chloroflexota bacterium]
MARIVGLACFSVPGLILLSSGLMFIFAQDVIWNQGRSVDGVIPEHYERNVQWDAQIIVVGIMLLILGTLCVGLSGIGLVFR